MTDELKVEDGSLAAWLEDNIVPCNPVWAEDVFDMLSIGGFEIVPIKKGTGKRGGQDDG